MSAKPSLYLITNGAVAPGRTRMRTFEKAAAAGLDLLQIREPRMGDGELLAFIERVIEVVRPHGTKVLINDRFDIALASRADGVHLKSSGIPVDVVRKSIGDALLLGVSTHSLGEVLDAQEKGADLVTFGPVFQTPSKSRYGPPLGVERLAEAAGKAKIDLYALGGIDFEKAAKIATIPLKGFAMIRAIMLADDVAGAVCRFKSLVIER